MTAVMRGRFAPSPTGEMHLGNAWAALLAWLQVRAAGGTMVLRMEDLDPDRSQPRYAELLQEDLLWLGLDWDEGPSAGGVYGPYFQSERTALYQTVFDRLAAAGMVYPCFCTRAELAAAAPHGSDWETPYPGTCRNRSVVPPDRRPAARFKVPAGTVTFADLLQGECEQDVAAAVGDFVLRRADGTFAYQLAVVVDDALMHITHVLRGDDLLASTPRQILLYRLLGWQPPVFTHVPLLLGEDGHRLSKRHGDVSIRSLRQRGVRPETIVGSLAAAAGLLETFRPLPVSELVERFDLTRVKPRPVIVTQESWHRLLNG